MISVYFGENRPSGSGEEVKKCKSLTETMGDQESLSFSLDELKT
jgi:hypothetical protein